MQDQVVSFRTKHYFQGVFMYVSVTLGMAALILVLFQPIIAAVFAFITFLAITTVYRVKIDMGNKTCFEYLWILGFRKGASFDFNEISDVKLFENQMSQKLASRGSTTTIRYMLYTGYIIFDDETKVYVGESKHKDKMLSKLQRIAEQLRADVVISG